MYDTFWGAFVAGFEREGEGGPVIAQLTLEACQALSGPQSSHLEPVSNMCVRQKCKNKSLQKFLLLPTKCTSNRP